MERRLQTTLRLRLLCPTSFAVTLSGSCRALAVPRHGGSQHWVVSPLAPHEHLPSLGSCSPAPLPARSTVSVRPSGLLTSSSPLFTDCRHCAVAASWLPGSSALVLRSCVMWRLTTFPVLCLFVKCGTLCFSQTWFYLKVAFAFLPSPCLLSTWSGAPSPHPAVECPHSRSLFHSAFWAGSLFLPLCRRLSKWRAGLCAGVEAARGGLLLPTHPLAGTRAWSHRCILCRVHPNPTGILLFLKDLFVYFRGSRHGGRGRGRKNPSRRPAEREPDEWPIP